MSTTTPGAASAQPIALVVNDLHDLHHIRERGYLETPGRLAALLRRLEGSGLFEPLPVQPFPDAHIEAVHDPGFLRYLQEVCRGRGPADSVYPYVLPLRDPARLPRDLDLQAGHYGLDTFTPLYEAAHTAARRAADCALTAAQHILAGRRLAYALVRPPGHHAGRSTYGGYCYLNSSAIAAHYLSRHGRVAVLDLDYHHGNGTQDIFCRRADVLTVSIHGHPSIAYPYFCGYADETGEGEGVGYNINLPLPEETGGAAYRQALAQALEAIRRFAPRFLVVALGLDTARRDPCGSWGLLASDMRANGHMVGTLQLPTLAVQEGGYYTRTLGTNVRHFFQGLWAGHSGGASIVPPPQLPSSAMGRGKTRD